MFQRNLHTRLLAVAFSFWAVKLAFALPEVPVFLKESVSPNILLTLDDSGSMAWGYAPDSISGLTNTSRFLAASFNPIQYDPSVTYIAPPRADGTRYTTSFTDAWIDGFLQTGGVRVNLSNNYRPTSSYTAGATTQSLIGTAGQPAFYFVFDPTISTCVPPASRAVDSCYRRVVVGATSGPGATDERQNFANWYSFYRVRHLLVKSGLLIALSEVDPKLRFAWQALNSCNADIGTGTCNDVNGVVTDNFMRAFTGTHRENLFRWVAGLRSSGGTPLQNAFLRAGRYFQSTNDRSPWRDLPGTSSTDTNTCRLSYHVALTDGIWNGGVTSPPGNIDNTPRTLPDGRTYSPAAPFRDTNSSSIADYAFLHWSTDMQSGMVNTSPTFSASGNSAPAASWSNAEYFNPRNDPANWQHLVTYTIGLGLGSTLTNPAWQGSTYASDTSGGGYQQFASGAVSWPATGADSVPGNVYDLWHAAINGRGEFFSAQTPNDIYRAFQSILARITARSGSAGNVASSSAYVFSDTLAYQSSFKSGDWSGTVLATEIKENGTLGAEAWSTDATMSGIPPRAYFFTRQLPTLTTPNPPVIPFAWSSMNSATQAAFKSEEVVNWLRGDRTKEQGSSTCTSGCNLRSRTRLLGDILGSAPVVSSTQDFGYKSDTWTGAGTPYLNYLKTKQTRTPIVLVGANDGFVHIFNARTGAELFGYMPSQLINNAWRLTEPVYVKRSYVDGPITVGDAYVGGRWRTYAVGTLGAGGRGAYALDITNPDSPVPVWDFVTANSGFIISRPVIARLPNGIWAAIFSSGYETASNIAGLQVVNLETGALIADIVTPTSATNGCNGSATGARGLGAPRVFQTKDGQLYIYAGDLHGNVWRFEFNSTLGTVQTSFAGSPFFKACFGGSQPQAITAAPFVVSLGLDPFVYFGTGRLFDTGDTTLTTRNSFYGVLDDNRSNASFATNRTGLLGQQSISALTSSDRLVSSNSVNLATKRGWFIDLPSGGERIIATPLVLDQRVYFNTLTPATEACESKGSSWLFVVDSLTGGAIPDPQLDRNEDGVFDDSDKVNSGTGKVAPSAVAIDATVSGITAITTSDRATKGRGSTTGSEGSKVCGGGNIRLLGASVYEPGIASKCTPGQTFRTGWRQIR